RVHVLRRLRRARGPARAAEEARGGSGAGAGGAAEGRGGSPGAAGGGRARGIRPARRRDVTQSSGRLLTAYYLFATPLFAALDLGLSAPIRAVGVERPSVRLGYYAATFALGWIMRARPLLAPWLAMGESAVNLTLLMMSVLVPIWSL